MALETYQPATIPNARWEAIRDFTVSLGQQYHEASTPRLPTTATCLS